MVPLAGGLALAKRRSVSSVHGLKRGTKCWVYPSATVVQLRCSSCSRSAAVRAAAIALQGLWQWSGGSGGSAAARGWGWGEVALGATVRRDANPRAIASARRALQQRRGP